MGKGSLTLLWQNDGSAIAYTEGDSSGLLMDDAEDVLRHRLSYDRLRDLALSPSDSLTFIRDVLGGPPIMKQTPDLSAAVWHKSSFSDGGANNCVEVADGFPGVVPVRDSKVPARLLVFSTASWAAFVAGVRDAPEDRAS